MFLTPHQLQEFQKYTFGEWIQTFATLMWTKVSICLFLLRIPVQKHFIRPLQAALVMLILSNVVLTILWIVQCQPVAAAWNDSIDGKCFSKFQKEGIIFAQASRLRIFPYPPAKAFMWPLADIRGALRSHIDCFRFHICCMPGPAFVERSNQTENQNKPVVPDGIGRFVRDTLHRSMIISPSLLFNSRYSTGSCCIVRTVLNGGSVPDDVTCAFPACSEFIEFLSG